jgi:hypothetical protein
MFKVNNRVTLPNNQHNRMGNSIGSSYFSDKYIYFIKIIAKALPL